MEKEDSIQCSHQLDASKAKDLYGSPEKRDYLCFCLQELYYRKGRFRFLPYLGCPIYRSRDSLWFLINELLKLYQNTSRRNELIHRVKRQLFREPRNLQRKLSAPQKRLEYSEIRYYKPLREHLGVKTIRRGYLNKARQKVENSASRKTLKRKCNWNETDDNKVMEERIVKQLKVSI